MSTHDQSKQIPFSVLASAGWFATGWLTASMTLSTILESADLAANFVSRESWQALVEFFGGEVKLQGPAELVGAIPFWPIAAFVGGVMIVGSIVSTSLGTITSHAKLRNLVPTAAGTAGRWMCVIGLWFLMWLIASVLAWERTVVFLESTVDLWTAAALAGWLAESLGLHNSARLASEQAGPVSLPADRPPRFGLSCVITAIACYTAVYTAMNWQMYYGLLIPHGDSAMYEEHLWNVLHGKGFRSYLDQGLFLGEHIQVIHLALIPLYLLWPSHLLLELCESFALTLTALPVYWIAKRHTGLERAAVWLAIATLLYFPLHYLDIAIDFKTFRPISFGVPLLMFAIDQMERRRFGTMALLFVATLSAKEDFAIVIAPLGVWLFFSTFFSDPFGRNSEPRATATGQNREESIADRPVAHASGSEGGRPIKPLWYGGGTAVLATLYLLLAVKVLIPWFRGGEPVHYARYFSRFGESPTEIAINMLTQPGLLLGELFTAGTVLYALRVVMPLGGTPLLSPSRLLVGAPLFLLLCLNELAQSTPAPVHHFHAPLVPIVLWAAAAGLTNVRGLIRPLPSLGGRGSRRAAALERQVRSEPAPSARVRSVADGPAAASLSAARFACCCALFTSAVVSFHPLSIKFWDSGRATYWRRLLVPDERAEQFAKIESLIPTDARVASTDFVHPRYTHHERSYDYSDYLRKVAGYEHRVPEDTDYIVIDTQHPYSTIKRPADVRELREQPGQWELLPDQTDGYFIVLRRK